MTNSEEFIRNKAKSDFEILKKWTDKSLVSKATFDKEIIELLAFKIKKMLDSDFNQLLEILYKSDVSEAKVKNVFGQDKAQIDVARDIAFLYVERLHQKWQTRQLFKTEDEGDWD